MRIFFLVTSLMLAAFTAEAAPAFGDRIAPRSSQKHIPTLQHSAAPLSPKRPANSAPTSLTITSSIGFVPIANRRHQRSSYQPKPQQHRYQKPQQQSYEAVDDSALNVPIFAAPVPAERRSSRAVEHFAPSFFETSAPKAPLKNFRLINHQESAFSKQQLKPNFKISEPLVVSENREALTVVPAPDLSPRVQKALQFSASAHPAQTVVASRPIQPLSNDNAFYGDDEQRRAVDNAQGGSEDDLFLFDDDEDDFDDVPSWVQPIFGRNGRALERSFYSGLDSRTLRYFTPPSEDELPLEDRMSHLDKDVSHDLHGIGGVSRYPKAYSFEAEKPSYSSTPVYVSKGHAPYKKPAVPLPPLPHRDQYVNKPLPLEKLPSPIVPYHGGSVRPAYASARPADQASYPPTGGYEDEPYQEQEDYSSGPAYHHVPAADDYPPPSYTDAHIAGPIKSHHDDYHTRAYGNEVAYGAETGDKGAFSYYVDIPVGCSGKYC